MRHSSKLREDKVTKIAEQLRGYLFEGEDILYIGRCNNVWPPLGEFAVTTVRILVPTTQKLAFDHLVESLTEWTLDEKKETLKFSTQSGDSLLLKMVPKEDHAEISEVISEVRASPEVSEVVRAKYSEHEAGVERDRAQNEGHSEVVWPDTRIVGLGKLSRKESESIRRACQNNDEPWLILKPQGAVGVLAAWDNRLSIIKTGGLTSLMAGSFGGERSTQFYYRDITGVAYNSGLFNGVLQILTSSYDGSPNKDYWRGSTRSRNSNSNDPYILSNTLPLGKSEFNLVQAEIAELRSRISQSKETKVSVTVTPSETTAGGSLADELKKLGDLQAAGILSPDEFAAAKARLLGG